MAARGTINKGKTTWDIIKIAVAAIKTMVVTRLMEQCLAMAGIAPDTMTMARWALIQEEEEVDTTRPTKIRATASHSTTSSHMTSRGARAASKIISNSNMALTRDIIKTITMTMEISMINTIIKMEAVSTVQHPSMKIM